MPTRVVAAIDKLIYGRATPARVFRRFNTRFSLATAAMSLASRNRPTSLRMCAGIRSAAKAEPLRVSAIHAGARDAGGGGNCRRRCSTRSPARRIGVCREAMGGRPAPLAHWEEVMRVEMSSW
jgi:hypothetical protein